MWVITGPFDREPTKPSEPVPLKRKLLKPGREYGLGRKDQLLVIKNKAISKRHAIFTVADCSEAQAADPNYVPSLTFHNLTDRANTIERSSQPQPRIPYQPKSSTELRSGDIIHFLNSSYVRVDWENVVCYYAPSKASPQISAKECATLGIHLLSTLTPTVTHHLTPSFSLDPALATSLISVATVVRPEWLLAVLAAGNAEAGELSSLEEEFVIPPASQYAPSHSSSLPARLKRSSEWQPNEERAGMFRNRRFIFVGEKGAETQSVMKELVKRGEGEYECLAVDKGRDGLNQVLSKGRARGATLVLVANLAGVQAAVGKDGLASLIDEAKSFELKFIAPEKLIEAVVYADVTYVDCTSTGEDGPPESVLPDVIPNTFDDEPSVVQSNRQPAPEPEPVPEPPPESQPSAPKRRLTRRAASRAPSRPPSPPPAPAPDPVPGAVREEPPQPEPEPAAPPRKALVRRAARPKVALERDDSMDMDSARASAEPSGSQKPVSRALSVPPTPVRSSRLKRRVGTQATVATDMFPDSVDVFVSDAEEPGYKKYKSLFDSADPDRIAQMHIDEYGSQLAGTGGGESLTQSEPTVTFATTQTHGRTRSGRSGVSGALMAVAEEEEESMIGTLTAPGASAQTQTRGLKRKTQDEDVNMDVDEPPKTRRRTDEDEDPEPQTQAPPPPAQKPMSKIITHVDMAHSQVHVKPPKASAAAKKTKTGEPDRDDAFLKAVASTKRGKKTEDAFDREFNNLRISKPDLERGAVDDELKVLEDFGDDGDLRGNFMVVMEIPVFRDAGSRDLLRRGEGRLEWQGRPDFKKFRRKALGERRKPIQLIVDEENDLGIGSQYWKGSSQAPPPSQSQSPIKADRTTQKLSQRSTRERPSLVSDSDEDEQPAPKPSRGSSRKPSKPPSTQSKSGGRTRGGKGSQKQPLFIDSDIEEDENENEGNHDEDFQMGDEDEEPVATLKSTARSTQGTTKTKAAAGRKKAPAVVVDDDSDDGATFKAFGARTRTRRR